MTDGATLLLLMVAIFGVFVCAVWHGGSIGVRNRAALLLLAAASEALMTSGLGYLPAASGEAS